MLENFYDVKREKENPYDKIAKKLYKEGYRLHQISKDGFYVLTKNKQELSTGSLTNDTDLIYFLEAINYPVKWSENKEDEKRDLENKKNILLALSKL